MDAMTNRQTGSISSFIEIQSGILLSKLRSRLYYLSDRNDGSIVGTVRHYQRHDHILQCFQYRTRPGCCYYGRRGRSLIATVFGLCVVHCIFSYYQRYGTMFFCAWVSLWFEKGDVDLGI